MRVNFKVVLSGLILVIGIGSTALAEDIRFHNFSPHPIQVALGYSRNNSVSAIPRDYIDPLAFLYTHGYITIPGGEFIDIPKKKTIRIGKDDATGILSPIRAVTASKNGQMSILHPKNGPNPQPDYRPAMIDSFSTGWFFRVDFPRGNTEAHIEQWRREGHQMNGLMFYHLSDWRTKDRNGDFQYGIGKPGTYSREIIDKFWAEN